MSQALAILKHHYEALDGDIVSLFGEMIPIGERFSNDRALTEAQIKLLEQVQKYVAAAQEALTSTSADAQVAGIKLMHAATTFNTTLASFKAAISKEQKQETTQQVLNSAAKLQTVLEGLMKTNPNNTNMREAIALLGNLLPQQTTPTATTTRFAIVNVDGTLKPVDLKTAQATRAKAQAKTGSKTSLAQQVGKTAPLLGKNQDGQHTHPTVAGKFAILQQIGKNPNGTNPTLQQTGKGLPAVQINSPTRIQQGLTNSAATLGQSTGNVISLATKTANAAATVKGTQSLTETLPSSLKSPNKSATTLGTTTPAHQSNTVVALDAGKASQNMASTGISVASIAASASTQPASNQAAASPTQIQIGNPANGADTSPQVVVTLTGNQQQPAQPQQPVQEQQRAELLSVTVNVNSAEATRQQPSYTGQENVSQVAQPQKIEGQNTEAASVRSNGTPAGELANPNNKTQNATAAEPEKIKTSNVEPANTNEVKTEPKSEIQTLIKEVKEEVRNQFREAATQVSSFVKVGAETAKDTVNSILSLFKSGCDACTTRNCGSCGKNALSNIVNIITRAETVATPRGAPPAHLAL